MISFIFSRKFCFGNSPLAKSNFAGFFEIRLGSKKSHENLENLWLEKSGFQKKLVFFSLVSIDFSISLFLGFWRCLKNANPCSPSFRRLSFPSFYVLFLKPCIFQENQTSFARPMKSRKLCFSNISNGIAFRLRFCFCV